MADITAEPLAPSGVPPSRITNDFVSDAGTVPGTNKSPILTTARSVDPTKEYVSGVGTVWTATYIRSLPFYIDDLSRDFGEDIYERIMLDAQVISCLENLKYSILSGGVTCTPCKKQGEEGYDTAVEISDFCQRCLDRIKRPYLTDILHDMLDAISLGNKMAELVYEVPEGGKLANKLVLKAMKVKPRRSYAFVVDPYMNLYGFLGLVPGLGSTVLVSSLVGVPGDVPNLFPHRKFAVLTWRPRDGDPRGSSLLRAVYDPWWLKQQMKGELAKFGALFAMEKLTGTTGENAQEYPMKDAQGNNMLDPVTGGPLYLTPEQAMVAALVEMRNGSCAAFPFGSVVTPLAPQTEGQFFDYVMTYLDNQIAKPILGGTRATEEAQHGSKADSQTGQDIMGLSTQYGKSSLSNVIRFDVLKNLVEYNYGKDAAEDFLPLVSLGQTEQQDFASEATAIAALQTAQYFVPSQLPEVDARLGLPIRSAEDVQAAAENQKATQDATLAKLQAPDTTAKDNLKAKFSANRDAKLGKAA